MSRGPLEILPPEWTRSTLGEISAKPEYGWTTRAAEDERNLKLLRTTDISSGRIEWDEVPYCAENPPDPGRYKLSAGDIVISRAGSVGVSALIGQCPDSVFASYLIRFRLEPSVDSQFVSCFLKSPDYWRQVAASAAGIALQNVNAKKLSAVTLPIAPLPEQHRIVAEIEKHFTRLDAAVAALRRARANLTRYRAAVLKAACEGRLVPSEAELAHAEGRDYEPADALLDRILLERRERWEAGQLAKMQAAGKPPKDDRWKAKYREPEPPSTGELPDLPEGWAWATFEQLIRRSEYGTSVKCGYAPVGLPVLRIPNIAEGRISIDDVKFSTQPLNLDQEALLQEGDLLMCRTNGSISLIGKAAVVTSSFAVPHYFASYLLRFRFVEFETLPRWLHLYTSAPPGRDFIERNAASSAGQNNISLRLMHAMPISLPPLREQRRIVAEVERRLSVVDELGIAIEHSLRRAERLRQSVLKRAFEGKLVTQDPTDEPASVLLDRIRSERAVSFTARGGERRRSRRAQTAAQTRLEEAIKK